MLSPWPAPELLESSKDSEMRGDGAAQGHRAPLFLCWSFGQGRKEKNWRTVEQALERAGTRDGQPTVGR